MIVNATQPIGGGGGGAKQQFLMAEGLRFASAAVAGGGGANFNNNNNLNQFLLSSNQQQQHQQHQQHQPASNNYHEDACEILSLVLTGGPKWGFRIKQLNDNRVIVSRIDKGAAEKCGLKINDEILSVNNVQLSDSPRSLLLHDYPNQMQSALGAKTPATAAAAAAGIAATATPVAAAVTVPVPTSDCQVQQPGSGGGGQQTGQQHQEHQDISKASTKASDELAKTTGAAYLSRPVQLSKLDFAYQLIRHSSLSNKLMLLVKRFMSPAYARASVMASSASSGWFANQTTAQMALPSDLIADASSNQNCYNQSWAPTLGDERMMGMPQGWSSQTTTQAN